MTVARSAISTPVLPGLPRLPWLWAVVGVLTLLAAATIGSARSIRSRVHLQQRCQPEDAEQL